MKNLNKSTRVAQVNWKPLRSIRRWLLRATGFSWGQLVFASPQEPPQLQPQPSDVTFSYYRQPGDPGCLCSRCLLRIGAKEAPIVFYPQSSQWILRYHPGSLGMVTCDDWEDDYKDLPY
ncbi:hypothetical protein A6S26_03440 [Nostoc sp. ATCC 43529]|nr:hypothetical protein A6S26_03440 [Nostoc sp. ATCC 43529]